MRRSLVLFGLIALVASGGAGTAAIAGSHAVPGHAATKSIIVRPVTSAGKAAAGFHVKKETDAIDCEGAGPSLGAVDPNIDECSPSAAYAIACWKSAKAHHTVCIRNLTGSRLYRFKLMSSFASTTPPAPKLLAPLLIKLTDGTRCSIRIGGTGGILKSHPKWVTTYYCDKHGAVWASPHAKHYGINEKHTSWTVHTASGAGSGSVKDRRVAKAYFVGTAT